MTDASETDPTAEAPAPEDSWKAAAGEFLDARLELFRVEMHEAGRRAGRRVALVALVAGCAFFCWALLMAGLVGLLSIGAGWPWHGAALALAAAHLLAAGIALMVLRKASPGSFPLTRAELLKDRQWLDQLFDKTPPR